MESKEFINVKEGRFLTLRVSEEVIKTHYHELGEARSDCVIFAQTGGAGASAYMCWYLNMTAFANAGLRVYAPDFVGYGYTEKIEGIGTRVNTSAFLLAFMDALGVDRAHFVGNSMGSNAASKFAIEHPSRVKSLILTGGEPRVDSEKSRAIAKNLGKTARTEFVKEMLSKPEVTFADMRRATTDFFYDPNHSKIDEITAMRLEILRRPHMRESARDHAFKQTERGRSNFKAEDLGQVQAPTHLIHGRDERFFYNPEVGSVLMQAAIAPTMIIPDCSLAILSHCGHWPQIEKAETFNTLALQFLREVNSKT